MDEFDELHITVNFSCDKSIIVKQFDDYICSIITLLEEGSHNGNNLKGCPVIFRKLDNSENTYTCIDCGKTTRNNFELNKMPLALFFHVNFLKKSN